MLIESETILESQECEYGQYSLLRSLQTHVLCPPLLFLAITVTITLVELKISMQSFAMHTHLYIHIHTGKKKCTM